MNAIFFVRFLTAGLLVLTGISLPAAENSLLWHTQKRQTNQAGASLLSQERVEADPKKTAIIVCDMWDKHWCQGASRRVAEMAPRMNQVLKSAREQGVFIIHSPSETMEFYRETPQRKRAQAAPRVTPKVPLQRWNRLDTNREPALPIDDSDGGCDCLPQCKNYRAWSRQIPALEIAEQDAITDSEEAYFLLEQKGITHVVVMGVHANMCVLGRPFSIRQLVSQGKKVFLMRDLTDAMYNPRKAPFVTHFRGNELIIGHIETYWCPSLTSVDFLGGAPFRFQEDPRPELVFMIGEDEYDTARTLPAFAEAELDPNRHQFTHVFADDKKPAFFPGFEALRRAQMLLVSVRRRLIGSEETGLIREFIKAGKPVVAIRTSSHAFASRRPEESKLGWSNFDQEVLGASYQGHYPKPPAQGPFTVVEVVKEAKQHPIVRDLPAPSEKFTSHLYKYRNFASTVTPLLYGQVEGHKESEAVAWVNTADNRRVFYTSLGSAEDFEKPYFKTLLRNGILWSLNQPIARKTTAASGGSNPEALSPEAARASFQVPEDLEIEQVLSEPVVRQPVFLNFDERGRMWVVQYLQYPQPAGLNMVSHDRWWRAVYDRVPPPPPRHFKGKDKITIHEDTNGDGTFDTHKTFVEGLNIVTSVAQGRGGVWVLNPPYLLFYSDRNRDDIPDGDPEVHLEGFGLEDTHSVANSLRWGPDGWLYAAQGSTVTANIRRPGEKNVVPSMGQQIWRYHPETRRYEIFSEGGGNAFGVEIDAQGRIFSGHNGGNTRGFHYMQGAYLRKGFEKHGPLSNPHAYGFFEPMSHPAVERFTHNFIVYEGGNFPERYQGRLFGVEPLQGRVVFSAREPVGSTFRTEDLGYAVKSSDQWFRPVDIKLGPDGAIYLADWYDSQVAHLRSHEGQYNDQDGRIYRLKRKGADPVNSINLAAMPSQKLLTWLQHSNWWQRQTALRVLADRGNDSKLIAPLKKIVAGGDRGSLEALWALHAVGGLSSAVPAALRHADPQVRLWTVRLLGDDHRDHEGLVRLARDERNVEVRAQLACTARRLSLEPCLAILGALIEGDRNNDARLPLLIWWAMESHALENREVMVRWVSSQKGPLVQDHLLERLMRRYAEAGSASDLQACLRLMELTRSEAALGRLLKGFEQAFQGRSIAHLPTELLAALQKAPGKSLALRLRLKDPAAIEEALALVANEKSSPAFRADAMRTLGEIGDAKFFAMVLPIVPGLKDPALQKAALQSLVHATNEQVAAGVIQVMPHLKGENQEVALELLATTAGGRKLLAGAMESGKISPAWISATVRQQWKQHPDPALRGMAARLDTAVPEPKSDLALLEKVVRDGAGDPYQGKKIFNSACSACHRLFGQGGELGPDLTSFQRQDVGALIKQIVAPSAEIREGYEGWMVSTRDGRSFSGFLVQTNARTVVLRTPAAPELSLARPEIEEMERSSLSLMPEGLLDPLSSEQIRNLFAYLRSTQPLND